MKVFTGYQMKDFIEKTGKLTRKDLQWLQYPSDEEIRSSVREYILEII